MRFTVCQSKTLHFAPSVEWFICTQTTLKLPDSLYCAAKKILNRQLMNMIFFILFAAESEFDIHISPTYLPVEEVEIFVIL